MGSNRIYVVSRPDDIRGIYATWSECKEAIGGRRAVFQGVADLETAQALLAEGIVLSPGLYAFTDGNHNGGVGVVIVEALADAPFVQIEHSTNVFEVFSRAKVLALRTSAEVQEGLTASRNVFAELAALYHALNLVPSGASLVVVHDYNGIGHWMKGEWRTTKPETRAIVAASHALVQSKRLTVSYHHQRGHQASMAGRNDYAYYNGRADKCATRADMSIAAGKPWRMRRPDLKRPAREGNSASSR